MTLRNTLFVLLFSSLAACAPATSFQHVDVAYQPTPSAAAPFDRLVGSALEERDADLDSIHKVDGAYLGEMELKGSRGGEAVQQSGPANLSGRASIEAAARGATHFVLLSGDSHVESRQIGGFVATGRGVGVFSGSSNDKVVVARYALFRVEHNRWAELPVPMRPQSMEPVEKTASSQ